LDTTITLNKANFVYEQLRQQIISCSLKPGMPINETAFAQTLGVSKTPVREALRRLERDGMVSSVAGRGSIISHISSSDIHETFEVREIIECGAARHAAMLEDKEIFIRQREALLAAGGRDDAFRSDGSRNDGSKTSGGPYGRFSDIDDDMHRAIVDSVGNSRLSLLYGEILDSVERIRNSFGPQHSVKRTEDMMVEHLSIISAILEGDGDLAQERLRKHLKNALSYVLTMK
jgi:DNA-binding GntR family transcriptional regulator